MSTKPKPLTCLSNPNGTVKYWYRDRLIEAGYVPTGYPMKSEGQMWEMSKAAQELDTPLDDLSAFKTELGWEHFVKPGCKLRNGYVSRPVMGGEQHRVAGVDPGKEEPIRALVIEEPAKQSQLLRRKLITYRWWRDDKGELSPAHTEALESHAEERIDKMRREGFTSGELFTILHVPDSDPETSIDYTGWWEITEQT